jgi:hypothetical protein
MERYNGNKLIILIHIFYMSIFYIQNSYLSRLFSIMNFGHVGDMSYNGPGHYVQAPKYYVVKNDRHRFSKRLNDV